MLDQETLKTFEKLYDETYKSVLKYVVCNCSNIEDVRDIVQTVYVELLKKETLENVNLAYILGIAKNKVKKYYRFNYKAKIISIFTNRNDKNNEELLDTIQDEFDLQEYLSQKNNIEIIWNFLKKKNVIISKVFYLYYYDELSIKDIANTLNITESNVKNYLYRTLKELASFMKFGGENNV